MIKLLIIHNYYQDSGGEDLVFKQECELLATTCQVEKLEYKNHKGFRGFGQFLLYPCNFAAVKRLDRVLQSFNPDVVHIHNLHYAAGPMLIRRLEKLNIPVVMTIHNYRLLCPSATLFHNGKLFTNSLREAFPWTAIRKGVWSNSSIKTAWLAWTNHWHQRRGTWNKVNRYFLLTGFAKNLFSNSDLQLPSEKLIVKPNFIKPIVYNNKEERQAHFLFVGRLSEEKGLRTLVKVFSQNQLPLRIVGTGPLSDELLKTCNEYTNITLLGSLSASEVQQEMRRSQALIFPSEWYEGMPMTILEAFSTKTPVIASRLGAMESMITDGENGLLFTAGEPGALQQCLDRWKHLSEHEKDEIGGRGYHSFLTHYSPESNLNLLLDQYKQVIRENSNGKKSN